MSLAKARAALILELRRGGILDARVLEAIERVPREVFVPAAFAAHAHDNVALPIGNGQTISQPYVVALMTAALAVTERHIVLEIGTGSGYQAAVLALLARRVFTVERHRGLLKAAEARLSGLRLGNVTCRFGDGTKGWPEPRMFDRVMITAAASDVPGALVDCLAEGGILVAPVGEEKRDQVLLRVCRHGSSFSTENLGAVRFVPLVAGLARTVPR